MSPFLAMIQAAAASLPEQVLNPVTGVQLVVALLFPLLQQWLKRSTLFPWLTVHMTEANTLVSAAAAFVTAATTMQFSATHVGELSTYCVITPPVEVLLRSIAGFAVSRSVYNNFVKERKE